MKYPDLFLDFISDLYFQIQEVPRDFFVDIGKDMLVPLAPSSYPMEMES